MPDMSKIALIIGVDSYYIKEFDGNPSLPPLFSSKKDAIDLYRLLSSEKLHYKIFGNGPIIGSNLDKEFGYTVINKSITNFFLDSEPGQTILFYFSGHGIPWGGDVYLSSPQTDPKRPSIAGFPLTTLATLMDKSRSAWIVCIIDACYSGAAKLPESKGIIDKDAAESDAVAANDTYDEILKIPKAEGKCLLLSSQAYERSRASENDNSIYTKYLIEGMRGAEESIDGKGRSIPASYDNNGNITAETLHDYVYLKVANEAKQTPKIKSDKSSKIILAKYPELASKSKDTLSQSEYFLKLLKEGKITEFNRLHKEYGYDKKLFLRNANLVGAKLIGVDLIQTDLTNAALNNADLSGANLTNAEVSKGTFNEANLTGSTLVKANLYGANLYHANLTSANLTQVQLTTAILIGSTLIETNLSQADLSRANLVGANLSNSDFNGSTLTGANLMFANFSHVKNLYSANLQGSQLIMAKNLPISKGEAKSKGANVSYTLYGFMIWQPFAYIAKSFHSASRNRWR
jgi:uncharacterized protein YjbI with pentapeptide repeats